jgi:hypothetical protein
MKLLCLASALFLFALTAQANFQTGSGSKAVTCTITDGGGTISINKDRKEVTVQAKSRHNYNGTYMVTKRKTDGHTYISYTAGGILLTFSDHGDKVTFDGSPSNLSCPH